MAAPRWPPRQLYLPISLSISQWAPKTGREGIVWNQVDITVGQVLVWEFSTTLSSGNCLWKEWKWPGRFNLLYAESLGHCVPTAHGLGTVLVCVPVALRDQKRPSKKRVYFILQLALHHPGQSGQEPGVRRWSRDRGGTLFTGLFLVTFTACFLTQPWATCPEVTLPPGWALLH